MVLYKTKSRGGVSIVYIVPMCCLSSTSNKEHTFKVMRGGGVIGGIIPVVEKHSGAEGARCEMYQDRQGYA